jgi:signal transduction histidine kinase
MAELNLDGWPEHLAPPQITSSGPEDRRRRIEAVTGEFDATSERNFGIIYEVSKSLQAVTDLDALIDTAIESILRVVNADRANVSLRDPATGDLRPHIAARLPATRKPTEVSQTILGEAMREKAPVIVHDAAFDRRFAAAHSVKTYGIRSVLCVPMVRGEDIVGIVQLHRTYRAGRFTEADAQLVFSVAAVLAVAIQNTTLAESRERSLRTLRSTQSELESVREELVEKEAMAIIGRLTAGLVREIQNSLSPLMLADLIFEQYPEDAQIQEAAELMLEARERITAFIESISAQARGNQARLALVKRSLSQTVRGMVRFAQCDPRVSRHEIVVEADPLPPAPHDPQTIQQAVLALVVNAAEAMEEPGTIRVRVAAHENDKNTAVIQVIDTGVGIPVSVQPRIWEPFFTTKGDDAMGVGLDLCRKGVARHGGQVWCESAEGRGTVMTITVPLSERAP